MKLNHPICKDESGMTLVMTMIVIVVMLVCLAGAMEYTSTIRRNTQRSNIRQSALAVANGALEIAYANWREIATTKGTSTVPGVSDLTSLSNVNISSSYFPAQTISGVAYGVPSYTGSYSVKPVDPRINPTAYPISSGTPPPAYGQDAAAAFANTGSATTYTSSYFYLANANVTMSPLKGALSVNVNRVFELQRTSPWNWAIFYNNDLEINPGAPMNVKGWVHSNANLYTAYSTLNFQSKVTYVGAWTIGFNPLETDHSRTGIASPTYPSNLPPTQAQSYQPFGIDPSTFNTTDSNPNNDSYHELVEMPAVGYTDPMTTNSAQSRYFSQAGIKVVIGAGGSMTIYNGTAPTVNGSGVVTSLGTTVNSHSTGNNLAIYNAVQSAVSPQSSSIQDNREAATMTVTDVDISKLVTAVNNNPGLFANGNNVLYIVDSTNSTSSRKAIRLKNGGTLPTGGLTVVSGNAVYVQGDYNTGSTSSVYSASAQPPSNASTSDPTTNTVNGYNLATHPAAVVADAVSILSNAWTDAKSTSSLSSRIATNTTINTAIVSGIVPSTSAVSGGNSYSGGAENFPRLLEDWGGRYFTYYGSMVELYQSQQSTGYWGNSNVYGAPNRQWYFNTNYYTNPPPGTTTLIKYNRGQWFVQ